MNVFDLKNKFFFIIEKSNSNYLGIYTSLFLHLFILLFAIGLPDFFKTQPVTLPNIIPIEIINVNRKIFETIMSDSKTAPQRKTDLPEGWENYSICKNQIPDTPFLAFKVPLLEKLQGRYNEKMKKYCDARRKSGRKSLPIMYTNWTVKEIEKNKLDDYEVQKKYGANFVLNGSITVFGEKMRTNLQIVNLEDDSVHLSEIKDTEITELFELQDTLVLAVLESFKLEEDKIRVSNDDIKTIEELRLLQFAAKEREKWSRASYPAYEEAINKLNLRENDIVLITGSLYLAGEVLNLN